MTLTAASETNRRHRAFLNRGDADRPLIGSWLFPFFVENQFPALSATLRPGLIEPHDIVVEPFLRDVDRLAEAYADLHDDYPLSLGAFYAVPWMEAIMGCPIHFTGDSLWAEPSILDWATCDFKPPDLDDNPWYRKLLELLRALVENAGGRYFCAPTLMRGITDLCAALRGSSVLPLDVLERQREVQELAAICADVWIDVARAQLDLIPESGGGHIVGGGAMRYWAPQKGVWLQDDAIELLSPPSYETIFLPHVRRIASEFTVAFHLHGTVLWPVDILLGVEEIDVLQLSSDNGVRQALPAWKKIQAKKPCIAFVQELSGERVDWKRILSELSPVGLSLQTFSATLHEARATRDRVYDWACRGNDTQTAGSNA